MSEDYEHLIGSSTAMIGLAMIGHMLRGLAPRSWLLTHFLTSATNRGLPYNAAWLAKCREPHMLRRKPRTGVPLLALLGLGLTFRLAASQPVTALAQYATPEADCERTTPDENKAKFEAWFAALSSGSGEGVGELAAKDIVYHHPSPDAEMQEGGAEEWADDRRADYPDNKVTVEQMVAEGDLVASMQRYAGTQQGDVVDEMERPITGANAEWVSMAHFRFACGKIAEIWAVADDLGRLLRQGIITMEELASIDAMATPAP